MQAIKVWDGENFVVPPEMGSPRENQLQGCWFEKLAELAGRVCYDSLGKGRNSRDYHEHIREVKHLSVYEHCNFRVRTNIQPFVSRPGMYWKFEWEPSEFEIVFNLRTLMEWDQYSCKTKHPDNRDHELQYIFECIVNEQNPMFLRFDSAKPIIRSYYEYEPLPANWTTYFFRCSRACSHELVRHGDFTAISQRSTRYVSEELEMSCLHPLIRNLEKEEWFRRILDAIQVTYEEIYERLLEAHSKENMKQCRGAARQILPHCLATELIFSADNEQWKRIIQQRVSEHADAEIRELVGLVKI